MRLTVYERHTGRPARYNVVPLCTRVMYREKKKETTAADGRYDHGWYMGTLVNGDSMILIPNGRMQTANEMRPCAIPVDTEVKKRHALELSTAMENLESQEDNRVPSSVWQGIVGSRRTVFKGTPRPRPSKDMIEKAPGNEDVESQRVEKVTSRSSLAISDGREQVSEESQPRQLLNKPVRKSDGQRGQKDRRVEAIERGVQQEQDLDEWMKKQTKRITEGLEEATERLHVAEAVELREEPEEVSVKKGYLTQKEAKRAEIEGLIQMGVMEDVDLDLLKQAGIKPISCRYVLTERSYVGSGLHKARYAARGFEEIDDDDGWKNYASTSCSASARILISRVMASQLDPTSPKWTMRMADVKQAFLYADVDEDIYVQAPEEYYEIKNLNPDRKVAWKFKKALYGLRGSPALWQITLSKVLRDLGFESDLHDAATYVGPGGVMIVSHVDDLLIGGVQEEVDRVIHGLKEAFELVVENVLDGKMHKCLGRNLQWKGPGIMGFGIGPEWTIEISKLCWEACLA